MCGSQIRASGRSTTRAAARLIGVAVVAFSAAPVAAQGAPAPALALLERAAQRYASVPAFCARFVQELDVPLLDQTTRSEGTLCQMAPNRFLMEFSAPAGDRVVADGRTLWLYYPSSQPGQVLRSDLGASGGAPVDFHREFLHDPGVKYRPEDIGSEAVGGRSTRHIVLTPVAAGSVRRAEVWIDTGEALIRRIRIEQENGSTRTVELSDIDLTPGLTAGDFRFEPPDGVRVIAR